MFQIDGFDKSKNAYNYCIKKFGILNIQSIDINKYMKSNLYYNFEIDRYVELEELDRECFYVPLNEIFKDGNIQAQGLIIQFEKSIDSISYNNPYLHLQKSDTIFDLSNKQAFFDKANYRIINYGGLNIRFKDDSTKGIIAISIEIAENEIESYYVVTNDEGIVNFIYRFYKRSNN
jgi:hypothetical protein